MSKHIDDGNDYFKSRIDWIRTQDSIRVEQHPDGKGGFGVYLLIDGWYGSEDDARAMADYHRAYVNSLRIPDGDA